MQSFEDQEKQLTPRGRSLSSLAPKPDFTSFFDNPPVFDVPPLTFEAPYSAKEVWGKLAHDILSPFNEHQFYIKQQQKFMENEEKYQNLSFYCKRKLSPQKKESPSRRKFAKPKMRTSSRHAFLTKRLFNSSFKKSSDMRVTQNSGRQNSSRQGSRRVPSSPSSPYSPQFDIVRDSDGIQECIINTSISNYFPSQISRKGSVERYSQQDGYQTPHSESSFKIYPKENPREGRRATRSKTIMESNFDLFKSLGTLMSKDFLKKDKSMFKDVKSNYSRKALSRRTTQVERLKFSGGTGENSEENQKMRKKNTVISESPEITKRHTPFLTHAGDSRQNSPRLVRPEKVEILTHKVNTIDSAHPSLFSTQSTHKKDAGGGLSLPTTVPTMPSSQKVVVSAQNDGSRLNKAKILLGSKEAKSKLPHCDSPLYKKLVAKRLSKAKKNILSSDDLKELRANPLITSKVDIKDAYEKNMSSLSLQHSKDKGSAKSLPKVKAAKHRKNKKNPIQQAFLEESMNAQIVRLRMSNYKSGEIPSPPSTTRVNLNSPKKIANSQLSKLKDFLQKAETLLDKKPPLPFGTRALLGSNKQRHSMSNRNNETRASSGFERKKRDEGVGQVGKTIEIGRLVGSEDLVQLGEEQVGQKKWEEERVMMKMSKGTRQILSRQIRKCLSKKRK